MTCENCLYKVGCDKFSTGIEYHIYRGFLDMETRCEDFRNKADYKNVVRGEWYVDSGFACSVCDGLTDEKTEFCPHCGADMRGENYGN